MGRLLHLFNFSEGNMARKVVTHKRNVGGLEAPRNSLEMQAEASQSYFAAEDVPYSNEGEEDWLQEDCYPMEVSMKKLISEEISKHSNTRQNTPSIVARLMGMDILPVDTKPVVCVSEKRNESKEAKLSKEGNERNSFSLVLSKSKSSRQMVLDSIYHQNDCGTNSWGGSQMSEGKPKRREHPQEEELQKFKKEFEAWQASRFRECVRAADLGSVPGQLQAEENLNEQKLDLFLKSERKARENLKEHEGPVIKTKSQRRLERGTLQHHNNKINVSPSKHNNKECYSLVSRSLTRDFDHSHHVNSNPTVHDFSVPNRIVVLKPGPDRICNHEDSRTSSSSTYEEKGSIEDFLEEVREQLKCELQGKNFKRGTAARGSGMETSFREKPTDPKQIAHSIAKRVRENVTRDLGVNLLRSESTRSYRSEIQFNGPSSPEFISRDTRKFLTERMKNILKREACQDNTLLGENTRSSVLESERRWPKESADSLRAGIGNERSYLDILEDEQEMQTRSFRHGSDYDEMSPRNLVRSLSAPVSGTSFGKLLLEDRHILTGAHIRRKHEAIENVSADVKKRKKERFSFREKVSHLRYSFTLRKRPFGKKIQSAAETESIGHNPLRDMMSGPTVVSSFGERYENCTEVPPSPASVCSSGHEEFWRPVNISPTSTPGITSEEDITVPQVFREISSNLNELRRQLNQLEDVADESIIAEETQESERMEMENQAQAYIRDLLVASGLYDGSSDLCLSRWDSFAKPISNLIFEQVEESYRKLQKGDESSLTDDNDEKVDHTILFDLLNEALPNALGSCLTPTRFKRKIAGSSVPPTPRGRKLLDDVWKMIDARICPPAETSCYSLDSLVAQDLGSNPWSALMDAEVNLLGREVECLITGDLIENAVKDMWF